MSSPALRDVFTPGGLPSVTYVSREHLQLEKKLHDALARGYAFNVVTGPTKSGKSVLCKRVLSGQGVIVIEGGQIRSEADFWLHAAYKLNVPNTASKSDAQTSTTTTNAEGSGGIPGIIQGKGGLSQAEATQLSSGLTYSNVLVLAVIRKLVDSKVSILVDDFHYIPHDAQGAIIQALKSAVFEGVPVFLLAVPHRAFDPLTVEREVEGRFRHISIPQWSLDDLIKIPEAGFPALNIKLKREIQRRICEDSFGNPLLVQEICSEFCLANGIRERQGRTVEVDGSLLEATYKEMAESKGFPTYQRLRRGPEGRRSRQVRPMRAGGEEDIFTALLVALARLGPKARTGFEDIKGALRQVIAAEAQMPPRAEILSGLTAMSDAARDRVQGEPPLEWVAEDELLVITDPFLMFFMKWTFRQQGA